MKQLSYFLLLTTLLTVTSASIMAQNNLEIKRNDIRLGVGAIPMIFGSGIYMSRYDALNPNENIYLDYYISSKIVSPSVYLNYSYQFVKWFSLGANFSYSGFYKNSSDLVTDAKRITESQHFLSFTPIVRFDWLNREVIRLYSSVGIGLGYSIDKKHNHIKGTSIYSTGIIFSYDVTFIGITIGRKVYGFCEFGIGNNGIARAGVGYRFN